MLQKITFLTFLKLEHACFSRLTSHGDSALVFALKVWCNSADFRNVKFDLTESIKNEFDKNNIEIPFPQLDVHLDK